MATLKLNNKNMAGAPGPGQRSRNAEGEMRAPVRGKGLSRPRQSLEKAQGERQERQAQFEQHRNDENSNRPGGFSGRAEPGTRDTRSPNSNAQGHGGSNSSPRPERPRFADRHRQEGSRSSQNPGQGARHSAQGENRGSYGRPPERDARESRDSHDSRGPRDDRNERSGAGYQGGHYQGGQHQGGQHPQQQGLRHGVGQGGGGGAGSSGGYQRDNGPRYEDRRPARNEWQPQDARPEQRHDSRHEQPQQGHSQPRRQEGQYGRPPEHASRDSRESRDSRPAGQYPRSEQQRQPYQQRPQFDGREAPGARDARGPRDGSNAGGGQYPQRSQSYPSRDGQGASSSGYQQRQQQERDQQQQRPRFDDRRPAQFDSRDGQARREPYSQQQQQPYSQQPQQEPRRDQRRASGPRPAGAYQPQGSNGPGYPARPYQPKAAPRSRDSDDDDDDDDHYVDPNKAEGVRLSKHMGVLGMASRREADEWIAAGWVRVDGKLAVLGQRVGLDTANLKIEVDQLANKEQAKRVTILLNKPIGLVSGQAEDGYENASTLIRSDTHWTDDTSGLKYHIGHSRSLAPAGRLDIDSTGLLVLTQDGRIAKLLIGEDSKIEKEYLVRVEYEGRSGVKSDTGRLPDADLELLNHGLELDGLQLKPAKVSWQNEDQLRFVLREGRKRQIRRMCEQVGLKVVGLRRVRIGRISLGNLPVGQWRFLTPWERFD